MVASDHKLGVMEASTDGRRCHSRTAAGSRWSVEWTHDRIVAEHVCYQTSFVDRAFVQKCLLCQCETIVRLQNLGVVNHDNRGYLRTGTF